MSPRLPPRLPSRLLAPPAGSAPPPAEFEDYMDGKYVFETDSSAVGITLRWVVGVGRSLVGGAEAALRAMGLCSRVPAAA